MKNELKEYIKKEYGEDFLLSASEDQVEIIANSIGFAIYKSTIELNNLANTLKKDIEPIIVDCVNALNKICKKLCSKNLK